MTTTTFCQQGNHVVDLMRMRWIGPEWICTKCIVARKLHAERAGPFAGCGCDRCVAIRKRNDPTP